jgi:DNA-binding response OmpR family regulator
MSKKAVVVEDDKKTVIMVENVLSNLGYRVLSAYEGDAGLMLVKKEKPDLLVADLLLPGLHGAELCRKVKQEPALSHVKIIAISGVYNERQYRLDLDCKADAFMEKPLDVNALERLVEEVTGG